MAGNDDDDDDDGNDVSVCVLLSLEYKREGKVTAYSISRHKASSEDQCACNCSGVVNI